ncbi:MAG TPA: hypothetical protein PKJ51_11595 [Methanothrix sp.]|nr:hypothetical protein [Methanothrix sp.]
MPFSLDQIQRLYDWLPKKFGTTTYPAIWSDQWNSAPTVPSMVLTLRPTGRSMFFDSFLRTNLEFEGTEGLLYNDVWGHYEKATLSVDFQTTDPIERDRFAHEFGLEVMRYRLDLDWDNDKLRFCDILMAGANMSYVDGHGMVIYRSVIDMEIEGEISWTDDTPAIRSFGILISGSSGTGELRYVLYAPGNFGLSTILS